MSKERVHFSNINGDWYCEMSVIPRVGERVYLPNEAHKLMKVIAPVEVTSVCYDIDAKWEVKVIIRLADK